MDLPNGSARPCELSATSANALSVKARTDLLGLGHRVGGAANARDLPVLSFETAQRRRTEEEEEEVFFPHRNGEVFEGQQ